MATAALNHRILSRGCLTPPPSPSVALTLLESKKEFQRRPLPLLSINNNLPYQTTKCNFPIASCLSSSSPRIRFNPSTRLFVSELKRAFAERYRVEYRRGLSFRTTEESLRNAFKNFGELVEVNLVMDNIAKRPRGFAFLKYATEEESKKAIEGMHGKFLDGRVIFVEIAKSRTELRQGSKQVDRD